MNRTAPTADKTRLAKVKDFIENRRVLVLILLICAATIGIGELAVRYCDGAIFIHDWYYNVSPQMRQEYSELLLPLIVELDRTASAFERLQAGDYSVAATLSDGNRNAQKLLRE